MNNAKQQGRRYAEECLKKNIIPETEVIVARFRKLKYGYDPNLFKLYLTSFAQTFIKAKSVISTDWIQQCMNTHSNDIAINLHQSQHPPPRSEINRTQRKACVKDDLIESLQLKIEQKDREIEDLKKKLLIAETRYDELRTFVDK
jgi:hypothetical protein